MWYRKADGRMTRENPDNKETDDKVPEKSDTTPPAPPAEIVLEDGARDLTVPTTSTELQPPHKSPPPPLALGTGPKKNATGHKRSNTGELGRELNRDTADEYTDAEEKGKKGSKRKSQAPRQPTLQAQMTALIERMDQQAQRTDQIYSMVRPPATPERPYRPSCHRESSPVSRESRRHRWHVYGSHYKRTSPKTGHSRRHVTPRNGSRRPHSPSSRSSDSSPSESDAQVPAPWSSLSHDSTIIKVNRPHVTRKSLDTVPLLI